MESGPKSSGCHLTRDDIPRVLASCVVYGAVVCYGACIGVLGSAIPILAEKLDVEPTDLGSLFAYRGGGYFFGALFCSWFLNRYDGKDILSKQMLVFFSIAISGFATVLLSQTMSLMVIRGLFSIQGAGFGGVDTFGVIAISEMWGQRMQPWMQGKSFIFGMGGIVGPAIVNSHSLNATFVICGLLSLTSLIGLWGESGFSHFLSDEKLTNERVDMAPPSCYNLEAPPLPPGRSPSRSEYDSSREHDSDFQPLSRSESIISSVFEATAPVAPAELLSSELMEIQDSLDHVDVGSWVDGSEHMDDMISGILHKSEINPTSMLCKPNCSAVDNLEDPELYPINRTLSFATPKIVDYIEDVPDQYSSIYLVPVGIQRLLALQMLAYFGLYYSYAGWIPTYVAMSGIASRPEDGAYLAGVYYTSMSIGCFLSILLAVGLSTTTMMRLSLSMITLGCLCLLVLPETLTCTALTSAILGYAVSAMYPLILAIPNDYSFTMDAAATSIVILGGTIGESFVPCILGMFMHKWGPNALLTSYVFMCSLIVGVYFVVHYELSSSSRGHKSVQKEVPNTYVKISEQENRHLLEMSKPSYQKNYDTIAE